jgi:hypothetical protein
VPMFRKVDLTELMAEGVLLAANERFFWPLGLALTWDVPTFPVNADIWCRNERVHVAHSWDAPLGHLARCEGTKLGDTASNLHVRQYEYEDGHVEGIGADDADPVYAERRGRFETWWLARLASMPVGERRRAIAAARRPKP